ncbi:DUF424 family protein [Sulfolobus sp. S-194]|uniref:DUF424 domain-containing protein n=1 Tax=Sulfolobus sp. S-194 TaxID=2512240 RepID=UPI00143726B8|nr:DUF424 family protein [Sulfolobus sp. S-194]QIW23380.1 DUF424 family protein [Sulfolobus sp. S-194]
MKVSLNIIRREGYVFVNICELELIGKTFKEGEVNLVVNKEFYEGQEVSLDYAFSFLDEANVVSIVGNKIVEEALKRGFLKEEGIISVQGVKFAQIYNM